ncbi:MAG: hypothetical protein A4E56_03240 [Pelotomaculum sp. PtaU1.Bin065]|nr:MAG: hypothetical protein A4E56_03240 [Pelotomaculum sp. PtaU1.Bin065]
MAVSIFDVANYFLSKIDFGSGGSITPLKLQKLTYYAQAWYLVFYDRPLFGEHFEAWAHGPANPELFRLYKGYGWRSIEPLDDFCPNMFSDEQIEHLDEVWEAYGMYDGKYLENLTHQEDPWLEARGGCRAGDICDNIITQDSMKRYYSKVLQESNAQ